MPMTEPGNGGGDFPAEEFLAEVVDVRDRDANDRMPGLLEGGDLGVLILRRESDSRRT